MKQLIYLAGFTIGVCTAVGGIIIYSTKFWGDARFLIFAICCVVSGFIVAHASLSVNDKTD